MSFLVHSHELEDEVSQACKVQDEDEDHARATLAAREECGEQEDHDGKGNGGHCETPFSVRNVRHNDEELDGEAEEEEEIEFEEGDIDL